MNSLLRKISLSGAAIALGAMPLAARAQNNPARGPARNGQPQQQQSYTPAEFDEAVKFMEANAPHRLAVMKGFTAPRAVENAKWTIVNQKRNFERVKANNADSPEVYQARLREYQINDDIFDLCRQMIQKPKSVATIEPQLREKVQELFDVGIQERKARIDRLEKQLARLKREVQNDEAKRDDLVAKNYEVIRKEGVPGALVPNTPEPKLADRPPAGGNNK